MKKSKFTDSQIMEALKRAESGLAVSEVCRDDTSYRKGNLVFLLTQSATNNSQYPDKILHPIAQKS